MARILRRIRVMLSSRNLDLVPSGDRAVPLETVRRALKEELEVETLCGHPLLEVWINEEAGAADGTEDAWGKCMEQVDEADIVVVIYNGHAGWTKSTGGVGICHGEFDRVWSRSPSRMRLVGLKFDSIPKLGLRSPKEIAEENEVNRRFYDQIERYSLFQAFAFDDTSLKDEVRRAVASAVSELAYAGSREGRKGKYYFGAPLDWSRLNYPQRKEEIEKAVGAFLEGKGSAAPKEGVYALDIRGANVAMKAHGIPSGFGIAEAREMAGRPFLKDHTTTVALPDSQLLGPVHILACHKKCTESQVTRFMGQPDLFLVSAPFGHFVSDPTGFAQAFFLVDCRDETSTRLACQRMFDWIEESGESARIVERAVSRARILKTVAAEIARGSGGSGSSVTPMGGGPGSTPRRRKVRPR
jgi:hypothetical protein